jgi:F-box protein 21
MFICCCSSEVLFHCFEFFDVATLLIASLVSKRWHEIANSNILWKNFITWKYWANETNLDQYGVPPSKLPWKTIFLQRNFKDNRAQKLLTQMEYPWSSKMAEKILVRDGMDIYEKLLSIVNEEPLTKNLTQKHCALQILKKITRKQLSKCWDDWRKDPNKYALEDGAIWIAKWEDPLLDSAAIYHELDSVAREIQQHVFSESQQSLTVTKELLTKVNSYFFEKLNFHGNQENYYDPHNSYIQYVLKRRCGIPISLSLIYAAVCRRLGISINMVISLNSDHKPTKNEEAKRMRRVTRE